MSKRSKAKRKSSLRTEPAPGPATRSSPGAPRRVRLWLALPAISIIVPLLLLGLAEAGLRICGVGYPTSFFELSPDGTVFSNPKFGWQFYSRDTSIAPTPLRFQKQKAPDAFRIFILGESAAAGTPDPAFGFARQLELQLQTQFPDRRFEVLNVAMRGINSYIIQKIAGECAALSPDLFLVYMGNNEVIGLHGPSERTPPWTMNPTLLRLIRTIKASRLAQAEESLLRRFMPARKSPAQDLAYLRRQRLAFDHPCRSLVYRNFEANLRNICGAIEKSGAKSILCSVAVNLRDFPPLGSLHRKDLTATQLGEWDTLVVEGARAESQGQLNLAVAKYNSALLLDDHFAELHYRLARCLDRLGQIEEAAKHFRLACDRDALQFRADGRLNEIIAAAAKARGGAASFLDLARDFAELQFKEPLPARAPLFQEHVHFTFLGDHTAARLLLPAVTSALGLPASSRTPLTPEECALQLAYTDVDQANVRAATVRLTSGAVFQDQLEHAERQRLAEREVQNQLQSITPDDLRRALETYRKALSKRPDDWMLRYNFALLLADSGDHTQAANEHARIVELFPREKAFRVALGKSLFQSGRLADATAQFEAALRLDPYYPPAREAISQVRKGNG